MPSEVLCRSFATEEVTFDGDRRVLEGRLVPYGEVARVVDHLPDGRPDVYREGFRPHAFARQANPNEPGKARRIGLVHAHEDGLGFLGNFRLLRDQDDGLWGEVAVLRSKTPDVEDLLAEGVDGLSIEFRERRNGTTVDGDGVRWRTDVHLDRVALEAAGAYSGARVTAFRSAADMALLDEYEDEAAEAATKAKRAAALDELDTWIAEQQQRQADLVERFST